MAFDTLGLKGDLDDVELLMDIESAFGIHIANDEAARLFTVGDIYTLLQNKLSSTKEADKCATAMTFYRLRSALAAFGVDKKLITPTTPVRDMSTLKAADFFKQLKSRTQMTMPRPQASWRGILGNSSALFGVISFFYCLFLPAAQNFWPPSAILFVSGILLCRADQGKLPENFTLAELSQKVAGMNAGKLITEGAKPSDDYLWQALMVVLTEHSALPPSEITPSTALLVKQR
ncbi:MAG TPA: hypothetical protein DIW20_02990 [Rhodospirillaceae bacterium]|nr:hypothetical protein [Rhodospirillaceae bacterium]